MNDMKLILQEKNAQRLQNIGPVLQQVVSIAIVVVVVLVGTEIVFAKQQLK